MSADPIYDGVKEGFGLYTYCRNNPLVYTDPSGLECGTNDEYNGRNYKKVPTTDNKGDWIYNPENYDPSMDFAYDTNKKLIKAEKQHKYYKEKKDEVKKLLKDNGLNKNPIYRGYYCGPEWNGGIKGDENAFEHFPNSLDSIDKLGLIHDGECLDFETKKPFAPEILLKADAKLAIGFTKQLFMPVTAIDNKGNEFRVPFTDEVKGKLYSLGGAIGFGARTIGWGVKIGYNYIKSKLQRR